MAVSHSIYTCRPNKHNKLENVANLNVLFLIACEQAFSRAFPFPFLAIFPQTESLFTGYLSHYVALMLFIP